MVGIYRIVNKVNGKSYIGQSKDIYRRFFEHKTKCKQNNQSIGRAIKKYGKENFELEILEHCNEFDREKLNELEIKYIAIYKPEYNRTLGGAGQLGMCVGEETRKVLSNYGKKQWESKTQEEKDRIINGNLTGVTIGHKVSEETKEKLRKANLGKKQSEDTIKKRKISQQETWNRKGGKDATSHFKRVKLVEINMEFESVIACAKFLGVQSTAVSSVLKNRRGRKTIHGYHVVYVV